MTDKQDYLTFMRSLSDRKVLEELAISNWVNPDLPTIDLTSQIIQSKISIDIYFFCEELMTRVKNNFWAAEDYDIITGQINELIREVRDEHTIKSPAKEEKEFSSKGESEPQSGADQV